MDDEEPVRFTELTDSDIYSLRRNEITVLNGCVIGIIYINIPSRTKNELNTQYNPKIKKESPKNQPTKKASFLDSA